MAAAVHDDDNEALQFRFSSHNGIIECDNKKKQTGNKQKKKNKTE